jgi:hypothetical protein
MNCENVIKKAASVAKRIFVASVASRLMNEQKKYLKIISADKVVKKIACT